MAHYEQYYVRPDDVALASLTLREEEWYHVSRVLRKRVGDWLIAVDGEGHRYQGPILELIDKTVIVKIERQDYWIGEPRLRLTLALALLKGNQWDWVVEKATEIGVGIFQPLITEFTLKQGEGRGDRWLRLARAAMKQCGRSRCPHILEPMPLESFLKAHRDQSLYIAHTCEDSVTVEWVNGLAVKDRAILLVGPEGGFSDAEFRLARDYGAHVLPLGHRRLRSDTAALVGSVLILAGAGDMGVSTLINRQAF